MCTKRTKEIWFNGCLINVQCRPYIRQEYKNLMREYKEGIRLWLGLVVEVQGDKLEIYSTHSRALLFVATAQSVLTISV